MSPTPAATTTSNGPPAGDGGKTVLSRAAIARLVAEVARSTDGVVDLDDGVVGEFATYGEGRRVGGVTIGESETPVRVAIRVVLDLASPVHERAQQVRERVLEHLSVQGEERAMEVDVHVHDVVVEPDTGQGHDATAATGGGLR